MRRLLITLFVLAALLVAVSLAAGELLTRPVRRSIGPLPPGLVAEPVRIPYTGVHGDAQQVSGWFLPGRAGEGAVLLQHGVRSDRLQMLDRARWLQREGIASLVIDLPAHGESSGDRITLGRWEALGTQAALGWLRARVPGERVGGIGVSLGGASLLFAARRPELNALVLESVYPTVEDAVEDRLAMRLGAPGRWLAPLLLVQVPLRLGFGTEALRPVDAVAGVQAPLLVASGALDEHTTWPETQRLFDRAMPPKTLWAVPGAAHVDLHAYDPVAYEARLGPWLHQQLRKPPA